MGVAIKLWVQKHTYVTKMSNASK